VLWCWRGMPRCRKWHPVWQDGAGACWPLRGSGAGQERRAVGQVERTRRLPAYRWGDVPGTNSLRCCCSTGPLTASSPLWTIRTWSAIWCWRTTASCGYRYAGRTTPTTRRCWGSRRARRRPYRRSWAKPAGKLIVDLDSFSWVASAPSPNRTGPYGTRTDRCAGLSGDPGTHR